jgi:hypothetical protein
LNIAVVTEGVQCALSLSEVDFGLGWNWHTLEKSFLTELITIQENNRKNTGREQHVSETDF